MDFTPATPSSSNSSSKILPTPLLLDAANAAQPQSAGRRQSYKPMHSSPLARSSSPFSSPTHENNPPEAESPLANKARLAHARFGQYKATPFSSGGRLLRPNKASRRSQRSSIFQYDNNSSPGSGPVASGSSSPLEHSTQTFLRERFYARASDRAKKAGKFRTAGKRRRRRTFPPDDDPFMDDAEDDDMGEDGDDGLLDDELFNRVMLNMESRARHQYRVSYERDVGSSFDPNMDDPTDWERELNEEQPPEDLDDDGAALAAAYAEDINEPPEPPRHQWTDAEWDALFDDLPDEVFLAADPEQGSSPQTAANEMDMDMDF